MKNINQYITEKANFLVKKHVSKGKLVDINQLTIYNGRDIHNHKNIDNCIKIVYKKKVTDDAIYSARYVDMKELIDSGVTISNFLNLLTDICVQDMARTFFENNVCGIVCLHNGLIFATYVKDNDGDWKLDVDDGDWTSDVKNELFHELIKILKGKK